MHLLIQNYFDASIYPCKRRWSLMPPMSSGTIIGAMRHFHSWEYTPQRQLTHRPLYYTRYIGSMLIKRIQVDPGSALSIIPKRLLYFLGIPLSRLSTMTTTIHGFNAGSSHPLGKIHLWCQIRDLKSEVTCYVIEADMSYNLLLGWPWIHANWIVPSTLH